MALAITSGDSNARSAMNSDTVKPIPARAEAPTTWLQRTPSGMPARPVFTASQAATLIPTVFPRTSPRTTPRTTGLPRPDATVSGLRTTPELARAKRGRTR